jgi:hypothetical protein
MSERSERKKVASDALLDGLVFARDILWSENNTPMLKLLAHRLQSRYGVDVWALRSPVEGDNATPSNMLCVSARNLTSATRRQASGNAEDKQR